MAAPAISKVQNISGGVKLTWGKVTGAVKYRIFYKTGKGGWTKLADTTATTYTWKKAKSGTTYAFTVRCISKDGKAYTSGYNTTGKSLTYVATPTLSSVKNSKAKAMTASWKKLSGVTGFQIQYSTNKSFKSGNKTVTVKKASSVSQTINKLSKGKTYYVRIRSYKTVSGKNVYSAWSSAKSVKISSPSASASVSTSNIVYVTPSGSKYHRNSCSTLSRSKSISSLSKAEAERRGYDACKVCKP